MIEPTFTVYIAEQIKELKSRIESLEQSLFAADQANSLLREKLNDLESEYHQTVEAMDAQNRRLYDAVRQLTEYGSPWEKRRINRSSRRLFQNDSDIKLWEMQVVSRQRSQTIVSKGSSCY